MTGLQITPGQCTFCYAKQSTRTPEINTFPVCGNPACHTEANQHEPCIGGCGAALAPDDDTTETNDGLLCPNCIEHRKWDIA